ncbi:hypothetical protein, partial [Flavobacterium sp.]|uniref:hypothetical protein n=1 Tax=Flavobacterium sp. TaxID=239 RepID=UPI003918953B
MKNTTFLKFLEFPYSNDCVVSRGENGFKLDFSKANAMDSSNSKTQSNAKSKGVISILMLLILFLFSNISTAQTITVDGNPIDWNFANYNTFPVKSYVLDAYGTGQVDNQFTSSKDFFLADGTGTGYLGWVIGQTKAKNDIANAAAVLNNGILYFAGDRTSNNGDAQIGFWFYLNGTAPRTLFTSPNAGGDFAPAHAVGDLLILADFTGGGSTATVVIYRWKGSGPVSPGSSIVPNTNGNLETTNLAGTVAINNANVYPIPTGWSFLNPTYDTNEFYEGQVDLTSINLTNTCFSGFLLEARSSQSVTASLDDFASGLFNIRATATMDNVSVCAGESATFTAIASGGVEPLTYSFNGGPFTSSNTFTINPATANASVSVVVRGGAPNFCESLPVTATLTVNPVPTVTVNSPVKCANDQSVTITATPSPAGSYTYVWTVPNGATNPGNVPSFSASVNGTYSVVITTTNGTNCSESGSGTLTVNPSPSLITNNPAPVCAPLTVDLTLPAITAGSNLQGGTLSYWTNSGATIPLNNPNAVSASGTYYIKVTTSANCTDIEPVTVTVIPIIPIVINCPQNSSTSACAYADQAAVISAFNNWLAGFTASGGNGTLVTSGLQNLTAPNLCAGGSVTVNFSASDDCGKQASCSATFTITAAPAVTVTSPDSSSTSACAYADQAAVNAAFATWLGGFTVSGGCAPSGSYGQV